MEIFKDLVNLISGFRTLFGERSDKTWSDANDKEFSADELKKLSGQLNTKLNSINKEARKSTFDFPVLFSNTIPADLIFNFKESLENNYAQLLKIYLENIGMIRLDQGENKQTFLKRVRNLMLESSEGELEIVSEDLINSLNKKDIDGNKVLLEGKESEI